LEDKDKEFPVEKSVLIEEEENSVIVYVEGMYHGVEGGLQRNSFEIVADNLND